MPTDHTIYQGPERRQSQQIIVGRCDCHTKHTQMLMDNASDIEKLGQDSKEDRREMWADIKKKVPWSVFITMILLVVGAFGFNYKQNLDAKVKLAVIEAQNKTTQATISDIKTNLKEVDKKLDEYINDYKRNNGGN